MKKKTVDDMISQFKEDVLTLHEYNLVKNIANGSFDHKISQKLGQRIYKTVKDIINSSAIDQFATLLDDDNIVVAGFASQYLYPVYPKKCLDNLYAYMNSLDKDLDKMPIQDMINGFQSNQKFFVDGWVKLYGDNWEELEK